MTWTWSYEGPDGAPVDVADVAEPAQPEFPTQADAETWVGETWRELREKGVSAVTLHEDARKVYGPMSLDPA